MYKNKYDYRIKILHFVLFLLAFIRGAVLLGVKGRLQTIKQI